ncbi:hypothetical protein FNV43_RR08810 [Rhamnella rubrinervis]|uniref:Uncharacterized protein n=1 Tax=Rhamnella rubrinervis TaxID=2594499 RepID=A0A8K0MJQ2_9ROSA|nr:hypothetical protein FNV43_RR08810 [Rhamnella rubrinervis]
MVLLVTGNEDFVIDLPGQPQVNFQHYAGYVKVCIALHKSLVGICGKYKLGNENMEIERQRCYIIFSHENAVESFGGIRVKISSVWEGGLNQCYGYKSGGPFSKSLTTGPPMTIDEIFDVVLPPRSCYARGRDPGPKPPSKAQRIVEEQLKVAKERVKAVEKMNEELVKQIAELKACQDGMEASIYEKLQADMRQHFEGQGWSISSSLPSFMNDIESNRE